MGWYAEALAGQVLIGGLWNLAINGKVWLKGALAPDLPGQGTLCF